MKDPQLQLSWKGSDTPRMPVVVDPGIIDPKQFIDEV